jgi:hypothetical protein
MSREVHRQMETREIPVTTETFTCDYPGCGKELDPRGYDGTELNTLYVILNPDDCVSFDRRRHYCTPHLMPIWGKICELISADPDSEGRDWDDDD